MKSHDFQPTMVMTGTDRHRQAGKGSIEPQGTIVAKKKGDWIWWLASVALIGVIAVCVIYG